MLQIQNIHKKYVTGGLIQNALQDVSFNLRDNEFVAVLGQSGSGKTTLLNIIGGLDRYDAGDVIINGVSTRNYSDRDWDSYRNHTIGFVFQSYNLIPHQSVLANVELALTISGVSNGERRRRAKQALEEVGLAEHGHKCPGQLSGGQMQRVAIARALVNDPDILLADEPTGALDSETSLQVMDLLKEVAKDRLVVMVTHNPELAGQYANRIIRLHDGQIVSDSNPYEVDEGALEAPTHKNLGKAHMKFTTALALSFSNLRTKKARTLLTAFAGSIGIIGIALILSLSNGVNEYIGDIQKDTMVSYPITIEAQSLDLSSMLAAGRESISDEVNHELDAVYSNSSDMEMAASATSSIKENNLTEFKLYLDDADSEIHEYIGENGIIYTYDVQFGVYAYDPDGELVNTDGSDFSNDLPGGVPSGMSMDSASMNGMSSGSGMSISGMLSEGNFEEMLPGTNGELVSAAVTDNYDVLYGSWPQAYNEVVLVLDGNNEISTSTLYELGFLPSQEYEKFLESTQAGEETTVESYQWDYEEIGSQRFTLIPACDYYVENEDGLFDYVGEDADKREELLENGVELKIVGVIRPSEDASYLSLSQSIGYTSALSDYVIEYTNSSPVVLNQEDNPDTNVLSGMTFDPVDDAAKIADTIEYLNGRNTSEKAVLVSQMMSYMYAEDTADGGTAPEMSEEEQAANVGALAASTGEMGEVELAAMLDEYLLNPEDDVLLMIYDANISAGSYDENMASFGFISRDAPSGVSLYADSFEDKDALSGCIDSYNQTAGAEYRISYTDFVELLMSSVTTIVNVISYVLIAFVAVSLVVSSIMIGIITYISVLERTKEIGILRAVGASKRNISQVFNAETFIVGLISGLLGVGLSALLLLPINAIIHALTGMTSINAVLPLAAAVVLVLLSMALTLIAGFIPSKKAAKKDPVIALRTE